MKINDRFSQAQVVMEEASVGEMTAGNIFSLRGPAERAFSSIRINPKVRGKHFELVRRPKWSGLWEDLAYAVVGIAALVAIGIAFVRAWQ